jgi:glycerate-2-kinase
VVENLRNLTKKTLVLVVVCGGGSVLFDIPNISHEKMSQVNQALLNFGADITEINTVRKHLSKTKGGSLAKILNPAKVISLIFSDVPGNDLSTIASGPTVYDKTSIFDAIEIYHKYKLNDLGIKEQDFIETPKDEKIFKKSEYILILSNLTALNAMKKKADKFKINVQVFSDTFQSDAELAGKALLKQTKPHSILLAGGETTYKITNPDGKGGRNQVVVLASLYNLDDKTTIASFDSDGWDNAPVAGAIGDIETLEKAKKLGINPLECLKEDNSFVFFKNVQDTIITDRLESNISDLIIVYRK